MYNKFSWHESGNFFWERWKFHLEIVFWKPGNIFTWLPKFRDYIGACPFFMMFYSRIQGRINKFFVTCIPRTWISMITNPCFYYKILLYV
jgi:hypothetical protein